ncbi:hypothetical protein JTB14_006352 [Gonioctena quinquepunctata]|nr:hypothetical protein JTB14_006352 [Gonioctena quinquepunctata]
MKYLEELLRHEDIIMNNQQITISSLQDQFFFMKGTGIPNMKHDKLSTATSNTTHRNEANSVATPTLEERVAGTEQTAAENAQGEALRILNFKTETNKHRKIPTMSIPNETMEEMMTSNHEKITPEQVSNGLEQAMGAMVNGEYSTEDKWNLVENRNKHKQHHRRRNKPFIGTITGCPLKAVVQKTYLHVYKFDMKPKDVSYFLRKPFPEVEVEQLESKHPQFYSSFKVAINGYNNERAMNPALWPEGAFVNWFLYRKTVSETQHVNK